MDNFPRTPKPIAGPPRLAEIITPSEVKFIGQQIGSAEDEFKLKMSHFFQVDPKIIKRAYLVRLSYGESPAPSVVLCIRLLDEFEHELHRGSRHIFGEIHRRGDSYDHMLIDEDQEQELKKVCKPFYELA